MSDLCFTFHVEKKEYFSRNESYPNVYWIIPIMFSVAIKLHIPESIFQV